MGDQVVGAEQDLPLGIPEQGVRRAVSRPMLDLQRAVSKAKLLAVVKRPGHLRPRTPGAEASRHGAQRRNHVLGDSVAEHQRGRELVFELDVIAAVVIGGGSLSGGEGTVTGTLVGALMITVLSNGCSKLGLPTEFRFIIIGLIIVGVSAVNMWRQRRLQS